jgi:hypothetical protein
LLGPPQPPVRGEEGWLSRKRGICAGPFPRAVPEVRGTAEPAHSTSPSQGSSSVLLQGEWHHRRLITGHLCGTPSQGCTRGQGCSRTCALHLVMIRTRTLRSCEGLSEGLVRPPRVLHSMDSNRWFYYENKGWFVRGLPRTQVLSLFSKRAIRSQSTSVMTVEIMIDTPPSVSERGLPPGRLKKVEQRTRAAK